MGKKLKRKYNRLKKVCFLLTVLLILVVLTSSFLFIRTSLARSKIEEVKTFFELKRATFPKPSKRLSMDEFKTLVASEVPIITNNEATDFEKVSALREWAFHLIPSSNSGLALHTLSNISAEKIPLPTRYAIYQEGLAGSWCFDNSIFLRDLYELLGYEAYIVNMGNANIGDTDTITIVKIKDGNKTKFSVQSGYLNYTLVNDEDKPVDYFLALALIRFKQLDKIKYNNGEEENVSKLFLVKKEEEIPGTVVKRFENGNLLKEISIKEFVPFFKNVENLLTYYNYPNEIIYLHLFPFSISGKNEEKAQILLNVARRISGTYCNRDECLDPDEIKYYF